MYQTEMAGDGGKVFGATLGGGNFGDENPMCDRCLPNNGDFNGERDSDDFSINVTYHLINIYCLRVYINILAVIISERNSNLHKDTWWHCSWGFRLNTPRSQSGIGFCHRCDTQLIMNMTPPIFTRS